jgi:hypothetical protein
MASTSSKKMRQAFLLRAIWNSSRTMRAPCMRHTAYEKISQHNKSGDR